MKAVITPERSRRISPESLFSGLAHKPGSIWLDSSLTLGDRGNLSLIAAQPAFELRLKDRTITVKRPRDRVKYERPRSCVLMDFTNMLTQLAASENMIAIGYFSYEAMLPVIGLPPSSHVSALPEAAFNLYDSVLKYDHDTAQFAVTRPDVYDYSEQHRPQPSETSHVPGDLRCLVSYDEYLRNVRMTKRHIVEGDIYQANYTCRFDVDSEAPAFAVYRRLRRLNPAPYSAFLNFGDFQILSSSPERMFNTDGHSVCTSPIKGTIARGNSHREERQNLRRLEHSEKDRAELLMIVDLVRNDLGKIARTGSVRVDHLFRPEVYSSLIHLVADVSAAIDRNVTVADICRALFPGGSITGAPKKRAVEILAELETVPRSVYTGCIGYIDGTTADFNIAIRTMTRTGNTWHIHAGGGIVADSDPHAEYAEMLLKAKNLFRALGLEV